MYKGHCLCGSVRWELTAEPYAIYNCHCRMCQKVHGTGFGTYCFVRPGEVRWTGDTHSIVHYRSSEVLTRSACGTCGSVVPYANLEGDLWVAPGGCHNEMRKPDYNIFVADNAPWHTINGDLPECDGYPEESGIPSVEGLPAPGRKGGPVRGSCLCGAVSYQVLEPFSVAHNCHCSRCRHARAAAHASNGFVSFEGLEYLSGEDQLGSWKVPDARYFTQVFCKTCSAPMPRKDAGRGISIVPLGSLDDDPGIRPSAHIYVADKAAWHDITDDLTQHAAMPPSR